MKDSSLLDFLLVACRARVGVAHNVQMVRWKPSETQKAGLARSLKNRFSTTHYRSSS
jgi:hypothetical protein